MTEPDKCPNLVSKTEGKWTEYRCKSSGVSCSREFCDAKDHIKRADYASGE